jgi:acetyl-CoA carboxylase alpha subunit
MNVKINSADLKERALVDKIVTEANEILASATEREKNITNRVLATIEKA